MASSLHCTHNNQSTTLTLGWHACWMRPESLHKAVEAKDAMEAHSCVDNDREISLDEQYTTVDKYLIAGQFDPSL